MEERQKTGRGLWATSLVRPCFLWTSSLTARAHETKVSIACLNGQCHAEVYEHCTYVSGEVPGLLGAGFAEAASLPDSTKQTHGQDVSVLK